MTRGLGRFARQNTIALLALFLVLGGTSFAAATLINGSQIKKHSIAKNRLTNKAIKQLKGNRGPAGAQGLRLARCGTWPRPTPGWRTRTSRTVRTVRGTAVSAPYCKNLKSGQC